MVSWRHSEHDVVQGHGWFELRPRRRQSQAAVSFCHGGERRYGKESTWGRVRNDGVAHRESNGGLSRLRDGLMVTNQAAGIAGTEVEEDVRDGDAVLPRLFGSVWMRRAKMQSSGSRRGSKGVVVAAVNGVGALRLVRSAMGERAEGRGEVVSKGERGQGSLGVSRREGEAGGGKQELEPAACAGALSRRQQQL